MGSGADKKEPAVDVEISDDLEKTEISLLLEGIYRYYGYDFRNYVPSFTRRRIKHRIQAERLKSVSGLQERVLHDIRVMERLLADFSIHISEIFRDPPFFESFRNKVVPLLKELPFIRIWHAGCSTGEEVYSMAIILHEEGLYHKTKIYATDLNEDLLRTAKNGTYLLNKMQGYMDNYREAGGKKDFAQYFEVHHGEAVVHRFLSENVVFAQHNLVTDHSFNEFHVIICRNVLIYFDRVLQNRVHQLFYESLCPFGILALGSKEDISFTAYTHCYEALDPKQKIYLKMK